MTDNFGQYAAAVQAATVSFLKSEASSFPWDVSQIRLDRTVLQLGVDGGAGITHGVTDPHLLSVIMQISEFDDRVWVDGVPLASRVLVVLPPETHFTFVRAGPDRWLSWSMPSEDRLAQRLLPPVRRPHSLRTEKFLVTLPMKAASAFRSIAHDVFENGISPVAGIEDAMFHLVEQAWEKNDGIIALPSESTRSAEQLVFQALRFVQSKGDEDENVEIEDLARVSKVSYRTLLRAFEKYLKISPKRYLKLRQINAVYHAIQRSGRRDTLADILAANRVSEFGRFAGEYRAVFNEPPSVTNQRQMRAMTSTKLVQRRA